MRLLGFLIFILLYNSSFSQEWESIKTLQKETGGDELAAGEWLKSDRKHNTAVWQNANVFNLISKEGYNKYTSISLKRDFYKWIDQALIEKGHEVYWGGIAAIAAKQLAYTENSFLSFLLVRSKELEIFAQAGSKVVFKYALPELRAVYLSEEKIVAEEAENWMKKFGRGEQCDVLEPLYTELSEKALHKLERMAKGKGLYRLGIAKDLKYQGKIEDCESRYLHGLVTMQEYYLKQ
jgi:hypothetical protein